MDALKLIEEAAKYGMQTQDNLHSIYHLAMQANAVPGAVCEFGVASGLTAALMAMACRGKDVWLYDTFRGLPAKGPEDGDCPDFVEGNINVPPLVAIENFRRFELQEPAVVMADFRGLLPCDIPPTIAVCMVDCDFYAGTLAALDLVFPKLMPGAVCMIHDYEDERLPGVRKAVDKFFGDSREKIVRILDSKGTAKLHYFIKL